MFVPLMIAALAQAPVTDSLTLDAALELARRRRGLMMVAAAGVTRARADKAQYLQWRIVASNHWTMCSAT